MSRSGVKTITLEQEQQIVADFKNGVPVYSLSKTYGFSRQGIYNILNRNGTNTSKRSLTQKEKNRMIKDYEKGNSIKTISVEYKVSTHTVSKVLHESNINVTTMKVTHEQREEMKERYLNGESTFDLIKDYPLSLTGVSSILKKMGVKLRGKPKKITKDDSLKIFEMYQDNVSIRDISRKFDLSDSGVRFHILKHKKLSEKVAA